MVALLIVAGAGTAWAARSSDGPDYRTAAAMRSSVQQTVSADGTLAARKTATLAFAAAGTVNAVRVAAGSAVTAGEVVATLDGTDLSDAVVEAQAAVDRAKQQLSDDETAQSNAATDTSATTSASSFVLLTPVARTPTSPSGARSGSSSSSTHNGGVEQAQHAVVAAQSALDRAIKAQDSAVADLSTDCGTSTSKASTTTATADSSKEIKGTVDDSATVTLIDPDGKSTTQTIESGSGGQYDFPGLDEGTKYVVQVERAIMTADCVSSVKKVVSDENAVDSSQSSLTKALSALTKAVAALQKSASASANGSTGSAASGSSVKSGSTTRSNPTSQGSGSTSRTSGAGSTKSIRTITSEQIAADAKAIDAAEATVAVRKSETANANLVSPIAGKVASVDIAEGDTVSASSTTATITVVGNGALTTDLNISATNIDEVKAGDKAAVTVDGHAQPYAATVSYVGTLNSADSEGTSATYPVTVTLAAAQKALYDGMGASVEISVGSAANVLTVPLSALHTIGTRHFVEVVSGDTTKAVAVTTGTIGAQRAQVKSGLQAGERVVLADVGEAVPSSTTTRRGGGLTGGAGLGGRAGGGGFGGGGFGGAGGGPPGGR